MSQMCMLTSFSVLKVCSFSISNLKGYSPPLCSMPSGNQILQSILSISRMFLHVQVFVYYFCLEIFLTTWQLTACPFPASDNS